MKLWRGIVLAILFITFGLKIVSLFSADASLNAKDELWALQTWQITLFSALIEAAMCAILIFPCSFSARLASVFVFSGMLLSYRFVSALFGIKKCACLGQLVSWWPAIAPIESQLLTTLALWMFISSGLFLLDLRRGLE